MPSRFHATYRQVKPPGPKNLKGGVAVGIKAKKPAITKSVMRPALINSRATSSSNTIPTSEASTEHFGAGIPRSTRNSSFTMNSVPLRTNRELRDVFQANHVTVPPSVPSDEDPEFEDDGHDEEEVDISDEELVDTAIVGVSDSEDSDYETNQRMLPPRNRKRMRGD
jgi:hypothetical protein